MYIEFTKDIKKFKDLLGNTEDKNYLRYKGPRSVSMR